MKRLRVASLVVLAAGAAAALVGSAGSPAPEVSAPAGAHAAPTPPPAPAVWQPRERALRPGTAPLLDVRTVSARRQKHFAQQVERLEQELERARQAKDPSRVAAIDRELRRQRSRLKAMAQAEAPGEERPAAAPR